MIAGACKQRNGYAIWASKWLALGYGLMGFGNREGREEREARNRGGREEREGLDF